MGKQNVETVKQGNGGVLATVEAVEAVDAQAVEVEPRDAWGFAWAAFDFNVLADDVYTLQRYTDANKWEAVNKIVEDFTERFKEQLHAALKERTREQWKRETFERLRRELGQA